MIHYTRRGADRYMGWTDGDYVVVGLLIGFGLFVVGVILEVW